MSSSFDLINHERGDYAARCNVLREERHLRLLLTSAEAQVRQTLCLACVAVLEDLAHQQEMRRRQQSQESKEHYVVQLHRNPHSPMPTADTLLESAAAKYVQGFTTGITVASSSTALENELADVVLWEQENRDDLHAWEGEERTEMAMVMSRIVAHQRAGERKLRERVCASVLSGATVLEWQSYPSYDEV